MSCVPYDSCGRGCGRVVTPAGLLCNDCVADHSAGNGDDKEVEDSEKKNTN